MNLGDTIKLNLAPGETGDGKVVGLEPLTVEILSLPCDGSWNVGDCVLVELPRIDRLVAKFQHLDEFYNPTTLTHRWFTVRSVVLYDREEQYDLIVNDVVAAGGRCEGWAPPNLPAYRGMIGCAHPPGIKLSEIIARHHGHIASTTVLGVPE